MVLIQNIPSPRPVAILKLKNPESHIFTNNWSENCWIHTFPKRSVKCKQPRQGFFFLSRVTVAISCHDSHGTKSSWWYGSRGLIFLLNCKMASDLKAKCTGGFLYTEKKIASMDNHGLLVNIYGDKTAEGRRYKEW